MAKRRYTKSNRSPMRWLFLLGTIVLLTPTNYLGKTIATKNISPDTNLETYATEKEAKSTIDDGINNSYLK